MAVLNFQEGIYLFLLFITIIYQLFCPIYFELIISLEYSTVDKESKILFKLGIFKSESLVFFPSISQSYAGSFHLISNVNM